MGSPSGVYKCAGWDVWLKSLLFCDTFQSRTFWMTRFELKKKSQDSYPQFEWDKFYVVCFVCMAFKSLLYRVFFHHIFTSYFLLNLLCGFSPTWKAASLLQNFPELSGVLHSSSSWEEINSHQMPALLKRSVSEQACGRASQGVNSCCEQRVWWWVKGNPVSTSLRTPPSLVRLLQISICKRKSHGWSRHRGFRMVLIRLCCCWIILLYTGKICHSDWFSKKLNS